MRVRREVPAQSLRRPMRSAKTVGADSGQTIVIWRLRETIDGHDGGDSEGGAPTRPGMGQRIQQPAGPLRGGPA